MRELDIRLALTERLRAEHADDPTTVIRQELGLCMGESRVDVAVINGQITGYEIKSDQDTLSRLPRQIDVYSRVLDATTLVTGTRYADAVRALVPKHWGLIVADPSPDGVRLRSRRRPRGNPSVESGAVAQLLWRDEAFEVLVAHGLAKGYARATRFAIWNRLAAEIPRDELLAQVRERLKARRDWPGGQPPAPCDETSRRSATS